MGANLAVDFVIFLELMPMQKRNTAGMMLTLFGVLGVIYVALSARATLISMGWRWFTVVCAIPTFFLVLLRISVPESPRHLVASGKMNEAILVLKHIARVNGLIWPEHLSLLDPSESSTCKIVQNEFGDSRTPTLEIMRRNSLTDESYAGLLANPEELSPLDMDDRDIKEQCSSINDRLDVTQGIEFF